MGKRGPKPSGQKPAAAEVFSIRLRPNLRSMLEEIAEREGRKLSEVINTKLASALGEPLEIERRFGSLENFRIMQILGIAIDRAQDALSPRSWLNDREAFDFVVQTFNAAIAAIRPVKTERRGRSNDPSENYRASAGIARSVWKDIVEADDTRPFSKFRNINADISTLLGRPTVHRGEYEERRYERENALAAAQGLLDWPSDSDDASTWKEWGQKRAAMIQQASREIENEMIEEGKDPRLDLEDTF
ncbi:hypothetical protein [Mesorhizobium jarvisii]|uniref:hypothetical protein n=1 Tax=Mesorhizobium jarvisii TaxID=1777867 RepID=UPI001F0AD41B|nr:hypothetical protein [Mesorhizobium jarvisii]MCH4560353.1 hypothetical protein [Mesorhizobium jarvisii]